jgi:hypothetical protein
MRILPYSWNTTACNSKTRIMRSFRFVGSIFVVIIFLSSDDLLLAIIFDTALVNIQGSTVTAGNVFSVIYTSFTNDKEELNKEVNKRQV